MAPNPSRDPVLDCRGHMPDTGGHALVRLQRRRPEVRLQQGRLGFAGSFDGVRRVTGDPKLKAHDRNTIAALGPLLGGESLDDP